MHTAGEQRRKPDRQRRVGLWEKGKPQAAKGAQAKNRARAQERVGEQAAVEPGGPCMAARLNKGKAVPEKMEKELPRRKVWSI